MNLSNSIQAKQDRMLLLKAELRNVEWSIYDELMDELGLPIESEFLHILEEQEAEILENIDSLPDDITDPSTGGKLLTLWLIFNGAGWFAATVDRLAGYVRSTMEKAYVFGLSQVGGDPLKRIKDGMVQDAEEELAKWNYLITNNTIDELNKIVDIALVDKMSRDEFRTEITSLFGRWKVSRPRGVSVFNVTYPFNNALFESYIDSGIPFKQWISQRDGSVRPSHSGADGQIKPISDFFTVGEAELMYPGDLTRLSTNPGEIYGCRCAIRPVIDPAGTPN